MLLLLLLLLLYCKYNEINSQNFHFFFIFFGIYFSECFFWSTRLTALLLLIKKVNKQRTNKKQIVIFNFYHHDIYKIITYYEYIFPAYYQNLLSLTFSFLYANEIFMGHNFILQNMNSETLFPKIKLQITKNVEIFLICMHVCCEKKYCR